MKNAELIAGLQKMQEGLAEVVSALQNGAELPINQPEATATTTQKPVVGKPVSKAVAKAEEKKEDKKEEKSSATTGKFVKADLDAMTYNNLKKLAKDLGIAAIGNRDQITDKILAVDVEVPAKETKTTAPAPAKTAEKSKVTPISSKQKKVEPEPEPEPEEEEETEGDEVDEDAIKAQVEEAVADMSTEDIASYLADSGVSAKGKRQALIDRLIQAVIEGVITLEEDDEEGEEASEEEEADESEEGEEEDNINDLENPDMTEDRKDAINSMDKEVRKQWKKKELTREEIVEFLQGFYESEDDMSDYNDSDLLDTYIDAVCRLLDDSGELIEEGSYSLNGQPACCGRLLAYNEADNQFECEHCGEIYPAEEE